MVESTKFLKSVFFKNVSANGGAQAHAIKMCPENHIVVARQADNHTKLWGFMEPARFLEAIKINHHLFEIIPSYPYKVYFDVDGSEVKDFSKYVEECKDQVLKYFPEADMALSGSNNGKASIHIILQNYMVNNDHERNQVRVVAKECGFDAVIYTKNRLMKCVNQSKSDGRIQLPLSKSPLQDHVITHFFKDSLPFPTLPKELIEAVAIKESVTFNYGLLPRVQLSTKMTLKELDAVGILNLLPCSKDFDHAYTHLVARFCNANGIDFETFIKWRLQKNSNVDHWTYGWSRLHLFPPCTFDRMKALLATFYPSMKKEQHYSSFCATFDLPESTKIDTISQENFNEPCTIFNTGMGSGKTTQTIDYVKDKAFIWMSPSRALVDGTETNFQKTHGVTVQNYQKVSAPDKHNGKLCADQLLVTLHSLHYIKRSYPIVVIDEMESVLNLFYGDFMEQSKKQLKLKIWEKFIQLLQDADQVILLDAFTTTKTTDFLTSIDVPFTIIERLVEPSTRTVKFCGTEASMIDSMMTDVKNNKKVLVFHPLKKFHPNIQAMVKEVGKTCEYFNADIDDAVKRQLKNVNEGWNTDCTIINNVVTSGISYDNKDIYTMYIFVAQFNAPRDIAQVSYRARHLINATINVCYIKGIDSSTLLNDCARMNCPLYTRLFAALKIERFAPNRQSFLKFCIQARYKTRTDRKTLDKDLDEEINDKLRNNNFAIHYHEVTDIDRKEADIISNKCFEQRATMHEKLSLKKFFFNEQFLHLDDDWIAMAWNENLFFFLTRVAKMMVNENHLFRRLADLNSFDLFPKDITKMVLTPGILDAIFTEFTFKNLTRASSSKKIIKEIYNTYFNKTVVMSEYNSSTKNVRYAMHPFLRDYWDLYTTNMCMNEIGTWVPQVRVLSDEIDIEPDMI